MRVRPRATRNPDFDDLFSAKRRVILLNKSDLASPAATKAWVEHYRENGISAIDFVATNSAKRKAAVELIENAASEKVKRMREKGVAKVVRAMVVGIPNVGKSTFINRIARRFPCAGWGQARRNKGKAMGEDFALS